MTSNDQIAVAVIIKVDYLGCVVALSEAGNTPASYREVASPVVHQQKCTVVCIRYKDIDIPVAGQVRGTRGVLETDRTPGMIRSSNLPAWLMSKTGFAPGNGGWS